MILTNAPRIPVVAIFVVFAYASTFFTSLGTIADDPGLGWHLATGRLIIESGEIPQTDPFLEPPRGKSGFADTSTPRGWICEQWLSDLVLQATFLLGGWPLLYALTLATYTVAFFGFASDGARRISRTFLLGLIATVIAFKAGQVHLIIRPVMFSILLFPVVVMRAQKINQSSDLSWSQTTREAITLGLIFTLWANMHPAFVYGLITLAILLIASLCQGFSSGRWIRVAFLLLVSAGATVANPRGINLYSSIGHLAGSGFLRSVTVEWSPLDLLSAEGCFIQILVLVPVAGWLLFRRVRGITTVFDLLLALFFVLQAVWAVRAVPFAAFACIPLWCRLSDGVIGVPVPRCGGITQAVWRALSSREATFASPGLTSSTVVSVIGTAIIMAFPHSVLPAPIAPKNEVLVERIISKLKEQGDYQGIILASPDLGGALAHIGSSRFRPVLDDRTTVVGESLYRGYYACVDNPERCEDLVEVFGTTHVWAPPQSPMAIYFAANPRWSSVITDPEMRVFRRRDLLLPR